MENKTLIMADGHYATQYKTIFDEVSSFPIKIVRAFNVGDITAAWYDKLIPDPSYQIKLNAIAAGKSNAEAQILREKAWETDLTEMIEYALMAGIATKESLDSVQQYHDCGLIPVVTDILGNSDVIIEKAMKRVESIFQSSGLEVAIETNQDYISKTSAIEQIREGVYSEVIGRVRYICIPYTGDSVKADDYEEQVKLLVDSDNTDLLKIIILTHECPVPEMIGVKRPPVMENLRQIAEYVSQRYRTIESVVISGHIHAFPESGDHVVVNDVKYFPIGIDKQGGIRYALVDKDGIIAVHSTQINLSDDELSEIKSRHRLEARVDEYLSQLVQNES